MEEGDDTRSVEVEGRCPFSFPGSKLRCMRPTSMFIAFLFGMKRSPDGVFDLFADFGVLEDDLPGVTEVEEGRLTCCEVSNAFRCHLGNGPDETGAQKLLKSSKSFIFPPKGGP